MVEKMKEELLIKLVSMLIDSSDSGRAHQESEIKESEQHQDIGDYVIVRSGQSGVHFGILESKKGDEVILKNSRRCWRWWAKKGISLSALAVHGLDLTKDEIRITEELDHITVIGVCEIIPAQSACIRSFSEAPVYEQ